MSYTLAQATTKVRELINEETTSFWTDSEIQGWIQEGVLDLSTKALCVTTIGTITLATNQYNYTSSDESWIADCLKPKNVWYVGTNSIKGLQLIEPHMFGHWDTRENRPKYYFYDSTSRVFYIGPTPDSDYNGESLSIIYSYETDDITVINDEHQPLIWLYAASRAKIKERLYQEAILLWQQYITGVNFERQDKYNLGIQPTNDFQVPNKIIQQRA